jgi:4-hydroxybenzoate polyprenyltransferase
VIAVTAFVAFLGLLLLDAVVDLEADRVAHPDRPLPMGALAARDVWIVVLGCAVVGGAVNFALGPQYFAAAVAAALFGGFIMFLQGRVEIPAFGEIATPLIWASLPIYAFYVLDPEHMGHGLLLAAFHYLSDVAQDVPGGIRDFEGDREQNVKTFCTALGPERASRVALGAFVLSWIPLVAFLWVREFPPLVYVGCAAVAAWSGNAYLKLLHAQDEFTCTAARMMGGYFFVLVYNLFAVSVLVQTLV